MGFETLPWEKCGIHSNAKALEALLTLLQLAQI
jgi:hypothetical protein